MTSSPVLRAQPGAPSLLATWPDTPAARREVAEQLRQLNAGLLANPSATATLQDWCEAHGAPPGLSIQALRTPGPDKPAGAAERAALGVGPDEPLAYRRVRLACGDRVLSHADNWYRPALLTPAMNHALATTETPFGVVVAELGYRRSTLSAELLFEPPAEGAALVIPSEVMRHRAVLSNPDGVAISLVVETYTDQALFGPAGL